MVTLVALLFISASATCLFRVPIAVRTEATFGAIAFVAPLSAHGRLACGQHGWLAALGLEDRLTIPLLVVHFDNLVCEP